jgi:hypothetical protein
MPLFNIHTEKAACQTTESGIEIFDIHITISPVELAVEFSVCAKPINPTQMPDLIKETGASDD